MPLEVGAELIIGLTDELKAHNKHHDKTEHKVYQKTFDPLQVPLVAGTGTLDQVAQMGPVRGNMWSVRRLTLSGYTAGTVTVFIDNLEPIPVPQPGMFNFGRGELLLASGQRLVVVATGITGIVQFNGAADVFESWYLPYYIG